MQPIQSILETILYATNLSEMERFYHETLGLSKLGDHTDLSAGFRISDTQVLLIFNPEISATPGRPVPSHGSTGEGHIAFRIQPEDFEAWQSHLRSKGIEIEQLQTWETRGRSIYLRDPAGNSVELIDSDIWPDNRPTRKD
ncbi:MAG: VOC family protein [Phycisphaerales bacterium]|nr:VOC family protein [Phycisphaerales bacterium]